ncbi:ral guanine nucleotide dissociation stimulator-like [Canis lupus dingo]|uniref:ral guanine nucleotide dissociation stimulator-like n=1 Tax=Canis lupus dingo TaxID=286419 RepID=UPI000DC6BCC5|nr:ral guanine nucleotide dissociation stimulator-like [Canis lupus dingo]
MPRLWFHRHTPCLRAFARQDPKALSLQSSTQDMGQEWEEEILCSTSLRNGKVPCIANRGQCGLKGESASSTRRNQTCLVRPSQVELLEDQVQCLVPTLLCRDIIYISSFLDTQDLAPPKRCWTCCLQRPSPLSWMPG